MTTTVPVQVPKSPDEELKQIVDVEEEDDEKVVNFVKNRGVSALAIIASYSPRRISPTRRLYAELGISEEFAIESALSKIPASCTDVNLMVNSPGGAVQSSYMIAKAIRDRFKAITTYVPHNALSGGTLLALTGNKIFMGTMSELSPLNVVTDYRDGTSVSLNATIMAKQRMDNYFTTISENDAPYSTRAMADKFDATLLEQLIAEQDDMEEYVTEILKSAGYTEAETVANDLVNMHVNHGYVINLERAKKLNLKVFPYTDDPEAWEVMRHWLAKYMMQATEKHFIRFVYPKGRGRKKAEQKRRLRKEA